MFLLRRDQRATDTAVLLPSAAHAAAAPTGTAFAAGRARRCGGGAEGRECGREGAELDEGVLVERLGKGDDLSRLQGMEALMELQ
eukprot:scaffold17095_cov51-Isochrysis_galbana.AAC.1